MSYELTITLKGGALEIEADTPAELEKRIAALDLRRLEESIRKARGAKPRKAAAKTTRRR